MRNVTFQNCNYAYQPIVIFKDMNDWQEEWSENVLKGVPATALGALMNLSFDAAL